MVHHNLNAEFTGSSWKRWDPHIHAPGTLLNDQYKDDWEGYLGRLESATPTIQALGITDYFSIEGYRQVVARKKQGRLPNVGLIFPNVEMRLDIKTEKAKGINIHLLFSPYDVDHEAQIERLLSKLTFEVQDRRYACTPSELAQLGRAFHGKPIDDVAAIRIGANQFKTQFSALKDLLKDGWAQQNCLVAISGGSVDGTAGLQADDSYAATRQDIERFAHIVFSANPNTRKYWLGKGVLDRASIERTYRFLKPCLHGCDAHAEEKVGMPTDDRFCWIKGDLNFDTLRQAIIEPEERVWIGPECPRVGLASYSIRMLRPKGADWLKRDRIDFNPGLVTIIGARGSGKTALVELLAAGTQSLGDQVADSSFLSRASKPTNYLKNASVHVEWRDDTGEDTGLDPRVELEDDEQPIPQVRYLSQQFVDQLCSTSGLARGLRSEIERVIFDAIDPVDRLEADTFRALADTVLKPIRSRQVTLRQRIERLSEQIATEDISQRSLAGLKAKHTASLEQIGKLKKEANALIPKGKEERAKRLSETETAYRTIQQRVEGLNLQQQKINDLSQAAADLLTHEEPTRWDDMREAFSEAGLSDVEWEAFRLVFAGDVNAILTAKSKEVRAAVQRVRGGGAAAAVDLTNVALEQWPLNQITTKLEALRKEVGIDAQQQKKYNELQGKVRAEEVALKRLGAQITAAEGADARRQQLITTRRSAYLDVFASFIDEEAQLQKLYAPLANELQGVSGALAKLEVVVKRRVSLDAWAGTGEGFIDLRVADKLRGKGTLRQEAERYLLRAWTKGTPDDVASAMESFRETFSKDLTNSIPKSLSMEVRSRRVQEIAAWLYDTSHIQVEYGIEFDGVEIENLSPGTRGIVLLLLYLAVDKRDRRPLIVDQPEENLDPQSIYDELVPHFREARKRRQVILVTHNANLVVNTDADQVVVASAERVSGEGLPAINYRAGALENHEIRQAVCNILEGGNRAFLERERRYRFRWEETVAGQGTTEAPTSQ